MFRQKKMFIPRKNLICQFGHFKEFLNVISFRSLNWRDRSYKPRLITNYGIFGSSKGSTYTDYV